MTGSLPLVACPGATGGQAWDAAGSQARCDGGSVPAGLGGGDHVRCRDACPGGELESGRDAAQAGPSGPVPAPGAGCRSTRCAARRPDHLHRQVAEQPGQPGGLVGRRRTSPRCPGRRGASARRRSAAATTSGTWACGHRGQVVGRSQPHRVQQPGPRAGPGFSAAPMTSMASPGSSARCSSPARNSGRTTAPGRSPRPAAASC